MSSDSCPYCRGPAHPDSFICLGRCYMCGAPVAAVAGTSREAVDLVRHSVRRYRRRVLHGVCGTVYRSFEVDVVLLDVAGADPPPAPPAAPEPGPRT
jgi:hypothetical protein